MMSDEEITRLYRIRKTAMQMLRDRGYLVDDSEIASSRSNFIHKYGNEMKRDDLVLLSSKPNDDSDKIFVFFPPEQKLGVQVVKKYMEKMKLEKVFRGILVVQQALTHFSKAYIATAAAIMRMEVFLEGELLVNVTEHILVPKHRVITKEEKKALLERYTVKETQLPRMQTNDPVARYFGLKAGHVVEIIRPSETAGQYITYRYVC